MSHRETIRRWNDDGNLAFSRGWLTRAQQAYEAAIEALVPDDDDIAPMLYENLGLVYMAQSRHEAAIRTFLRALNGDWASRPQSARYLLSCLIQRQRYGLAIAQLEIYEATFGEHPDGWTRAWLEARRTRGRRHKRGPE